MPDQAFAVNLLEVSRSNPTRFLKAVFDGLIYDGFRFPTHGADGCIGGFCISKALDVTIPTAKDKLALHLNFGCVPGGFVSGSPNQLKLKIIHFHLTARTAKSQLLINDAGPSKLTAGASIHINANGDWGREDNIEALAETLDISTATLLGHLRRYEGYTSAYMRVAIAGMRHAITQTVSINAGLTEIDWSASDSTFQLG